MSADTLAALSIAPGVTFAGSRLLRGRTTPVDLHAIDPSTTDAQLRPGAAAKQGAGPPSEVESGKAVDVAVDRS